MAAEIKANCVCMDEKGNFFVAQTRYSEGSKGVLGWSGVGFNGERIGSTMVQFVASNINEYIESICKEYQDGA